MAKDKAEAPEQLANKKPRRGGLGYAFIGL
jgi:hypothetical protein